MTHKLAVFSLIILSQFIIDVYHPPSSVVVFTPTHLYFMSPSGSDTNDGLAPTVTGGHGPWQTPNHNVVCGDVILAGPGDYSSVLNPTANFGTVSSCPSMSGGIDGVGGIYFATLLCAGADLEACKISHTSTTAAIMDMSANNWSVQGWKVTHAACATNCSSEGRAFELDGGGTPLHHFAIINNVCFTVASCVHTEDNGLSGSHGVDYSAAIGNIGAQASMNQSFPEAAFDVVGPFPLDTNAGTHHYIYNNYTWNDNCGVCVIDSESLMFDSWDFHPGNNVTGVISNNISWSAQRFCVNLFENEDGQSNTITPTMKVYNNTCFHDAVGPTAGDNVVGELAPQIGLPWTAIFNNNIAYQPVASAGPNPSPLYAASSYGGGNFPSGTNSGLVWGSGADQNIIKGSATSCSGTCDAGNNTVAFNSNTAPTGIFVNPGFNNTTDLLNNQSGNTPNCSGFINTTACMGWNANTQVLTNPSVIYDLQPNPNCGGVTGQCVGKGFQLPSTTCVSSGPLATDYPIWLKGIVYLHASGFTAGATITQNPDLATRKCGL